MRTFAVRPAVTAGALGLAFALAATSASAQDSYTVEQPTSVLIFPKVVNDEGRDTVLQVTNNHNVMVYAHCFYTDGQTINGVPRWTVTDFQLNLTRQQTTTWPASTGRPQNPSDDQNGIDPGGVPPTVDGFTGSLVCVQIGSSHGNPIGGNSLTGRASVAGADYNAVGIPGINVDGDKTLMLDGLEYARCPSSYHLDFVTPGSGGAVALGSMVGFGLGDAVATVSTSLTVVPCNYDFATFFPASVRLGFNPIVDEFENRNSVGTAEDVVCWENVQLDNAVFELGPSTFNTARVNGNDSTGAAAPFVGVANVLRVGGTSLGMDSATTNLHAVTGALADGQIIIP